ncbi:hypothetical protein, partial [Nocardia abscessus]|uniref:hypothetical protein n=1 Tax=Nocardia abscessus TaxID=120957 RepID=UPI001E2A0C74
HPRGRNDTTTSIDTIPETDIKHAEPASPQSNSPTVSKMERGHGRALARLRVRYGKVPYLLFES